MNIEKDSGTAELVTRYELFLIFCGSRSCSTVTVQWLLELSNAYHVRDTDHTFNLEEQFIGNEQDKLTRKYWIWCRPF